MDTKIRLTIKKIILSTLIMLASGCANPYRPIDNPHFNDGCRGPINNFSLYNDNKVFPCYHDNGRRGYYDHPGNKHHHKH